MFDLQTNVLIWRLLMSTTMKSSIHLGLNYDQNLIACQNRNSEGIKTLFDISLRLIAENSCESLNLSTMTYDFFPWMRMTLCHDQEIKWRKAKVHVFSDSVLCLGRICHPSEANIKWKEQIQYFQQSNEYAELSGNDGDSIEFEWNIFPRFTSIEILRQIQKDLNARQIDPDQFGQRIHSC